MRFLTSLLYYLLALAGCHGSTGTTIIAHTTQNGVDTFFSKTEALADAATFHCLASSSGQCNYLVYRLQCATVDKACERRELDHFVLQVGQQRRVEGLDKGFRQCAAPDAMPPLARC